MAKKYQKLTRENMRKLKQGYYLTESGIVYKKHANGDANFSVNLMVDGIRIRRTVGKESEGVTLATVEMYIEKVKTEARENRLNLPKGRKNPLRFKEAAEKYLTNLELEGGKNVDRKRQQLKDHLIPFFKEKIMIDISSFDIERYKKQLVENGLSSTTVNRQLAVVTHMFNKLIDWKILDKKPCRIRKFKEKEGRITYLTSEQARALLNEAKTDRCPIIYPFILIGLETAMRRTEILSIAIKDIDLERKMIYIPQAKAGAREQPITDHLAAFLESYLENTDKSQLWLFPSKHSSSGHISNIEKSFRRVVKAIGLDPREVVRHTLRHTAITHLVQAGVDLPTVKRISGHKTLIMVERYSHQNGEHIRAALKKLEQRYCIETSPTTKQA